MNDVVFRTSITKTVEKPEEKQQDEIVTDIIKEEIPYTQYSQENIIPYSAKYFNLGDRWEPFNQELDLIENYVKRKINSGEIANSINAVKSELKKMEKLHNLKDEERTTVKVGVISSYIKFLNESDGYKFNQIKYGSTK